MQARMAAARFGFDFPICAATLCSKAFNSFSAALLLPRSKLAQAALRLARSGRLFLRPVSAPSTRAMHCSTPSQAVITHMEFRHLVTSCPSLTASTTEWQPTAKQLVTTAPETTLVPSIVHVNCSVSLSASDEPEPSMTTQTSPPAGATTKLLGPLPELKAQLMRDTQTGGWFGEITLTMKLHELELPTVSAAWQTTV